MNAADVMVSEVITVGPDARVQEVAEILLKNRISAVPVVDAAGKIVGIVSEGDLLRRAEAGTEARRSWWLRAISTRDSLASEFVRSHAQKVSDVMTTTLVTAAPDTPLHEIAGLLEGHHVKRVPIVKDGKLVGIVSRANLLQALASQRTGVVTGKVSDDAAIRERIVAEMKRQAFVYPALVNVIVQDGTVELWGLVTSATEKRAVRVLAESTPGVRAVNDNLIVQAVTAGM